MAALSIRITLLKEDRDCRCGARQSDGLGVAGPGYANASATGGEGGAPGNDQPTINGLV